ncbi:MAG: cation:proton antiporter [Gammaproteobacteria bacterium]|nr:cation:proton antiporter [Gammaproteobacteria bacterium]
MESHDFFLQLLIILLTARLFAEWATRFHSPPVIGELLAGIVLGPSLLGIIEPHDAIRLMAGVGIILLLFQVGLETDIRKLVTTGIKSIIVASSGFIMPLVFGFLTSFYIFNLPLLESLFIGGTLTATSIGITIRVLNNLSLQHHNVGQIVLGAAVLDDILGVILLALLYEFSIGGGINIINASKVFIFIAVFFMMAPIAAKLISFVIKRFAVNSQIPGLIPTTIVSLVLFFAWLAHSIGAPELLGGFAAGLALSRRFFLPLGVALRQDEAFASVIEQQMLPIIQLFTPIFFVVVGLSLNLREIDWSSAFIWAFSAVMFMVAIFAKLLGALFIKEPFIQRLLIGISMVPRGEVGLIFAELGRASNIINNEIYAGLIIVIALTTLLSPFAIKCLAQKIYI